jgi:hypothetical protein
MQSRVPPLLQRLEERAPCAAGELATDDTLRMLDKALGETGAGHVSLPRDVLPEGMQSVGGGVFRLASDDGSVPSPLPPSGRQTTNAAARLRTPHLRPHGGNAEARSGHEGHAVREA